MNFIVSFVPMRNNLFFACLFLFLAPFSAFAQCKTCPLQNKADSLSFCYSKDSLYANRCVNFTEDAAVFLFFSGKKNLQMPMPPAGTTKLAHLVGLSKTKTYKKLKPLDFLFLYEALSAWDTAKMSLGLRYTPSGLGIRLLKAGTGKLPKKGDIMTVHYTGRLKDGSKFDSSLDRGKPFKFPLGAKQVIRGWDEGIATLKVGSKALLKIPPELGYGNRSAGKIPPNSTLYFEVEILDAL